MSISFDVDYFEESEANIKKVIDRNYFTCYNRVMLLYVDL